MDQNNSEATKSSEKQLDWLYQNNTELVNRGEYLLGRKVDKSFELLNAEENKSNQQTTLGVKQSLNHVEHECIPFSIRAYRGTDSKDQVDLQRKIMEDPLMLIKQREMESRRKLLENPVKLKELHRILKSEKDLTKSSSAKKKKKAKSKKSKKKHSKHSSDSSSDEDLDRKLTKRYKIVKALQNESESTTTEVSLNNWLDAKYETISKGLDRAASTSKTKNKLKMESKRDDCPRQASPVKKPYQDDRRDDRRHSRKYKDTSEKSDHTSSRKRTITKEEKNKCYEDMVSNAKWREYDRANLITKYKNDYDQEEHQNFNKDFISKEIKKAIKSHTSVSSRIRSNVNNIQRASSSMNLNFAKK